MNWKKRVVFIFLFILSLLFLFILLDKAYFNLFFNKTPKAGNCLILEQKYCNTGKLAYGNNGQLLGITYKVKPSAPLIAPATSNISGGNSNDNDFKLIVIGNNHFDNPETENVWYRISFTGNPEPALLQSQQVKKGDIFAYITKDSNENSWVFLSIENVSVKNNTIESKINEAIISSFIKEK